MNATPPPVNLDATTETHEVLNQSSPLEGYNMYTGDTPLREAIKRHGAAWADSGLVAHGERCGSAEAYQWGFDANAYKPQFSSHDRQGFRVDLVTYHESYHRLMTMAMTEGLHAEPWINPGPGAHVARAAKYFLQAQVESGHGCPVTMTFAALPTLKLAPTVAAEWCPKILTRQYDPRNVPHTDKQCLTIGMGMTEKQGGSDVRANTTRAQRVTTDVWELTGHKWFTSAPMCDGFLVLAQTDPGVTCFLVPRWRDDGSKNALHVQRLKNKMGNVANASSEIEMRRAMGWLVGEPGRGIPAIIQMVAMTRFDCMIGSAAAQRQAVSQAINHAAGRQAFGSTLLEQPLMRQVLADLALEVEGSIALSMRMAEALDRSLSPQGDMQEELLLRLGLPAGKYWICKRTPGLVYEAMECLGGNGVTEDFIMARLYRDAPINAIWEGSGNIQALDVWRAIGKSPGVIDAWMAELATTQNAHSLLDKAVSALKEMVHANHDQEARARIVAVHLALTLQASLLIRGGNSAVAEAFIQSRLGAGAGLTFGMLPQGLDVADVLQRAAPDVACHA